MHVEWNFSAAMQMESVSLKLDMDTDVHLVEWKNAWSLGCHTKVHLTYLVYVYLHFHKIHKSQIEMYFISSIKDYYFTFIWTNESYSN